MFRKKRPALAQHSRTVNLWHAEESNKSGPWEKAVRSEAPLWLGFFVAGDERTEMNNGQQSLGSATAGLLRRLFLLKHMAPGLRLCVGGALNNEFVMSANTLDTPPGGEHLVLLLPRQRLTAKKPTEAKWLLQAEWRAARALPGVSCDATVRRQSARLLAASKQRLLFLRTSFTLWFSRYAAKFPYEIPSFREKWFKSFQRQLWICDLFFFHFFLSIISR